MVGVCARGEVVGAYFGGLNGVVSLRIWNGDLEWGMR